MIKIKTCLSPLAFTSKPKSTDAATISFDIANHSVDIEFSTFVNSIANGQTFTMASSFKNNKRLSSNWEGSQVFVADIDDGNKSIEEITALVNLFDIPVSIIYQSFSSTPECYKWRLVFVSEQVVTNPTISLAILRKIRHHFQSDLAVVDLSRILYGTTSDKISYSQLNPFYHMTLNLDKFIRVKTKSETSIVNLPEVSKKKTEAQKVTQDRIIDSFRYSNSGSRHMAIFHCTLGLVKLGVLSEDDIVYEIVSRIKTIKRFKDYDRSNSEIAKVIRNIIKWKLSKDD